MTKGGRGHGTGREDGGGEKETVRTNTKAREMHRKGGVTPGGNNGFLPALMGKLTGERRGEAGEEGGDGAERGGRCVIFTSIRIPGFQETQHRE